MNSEIQISSEFRSGIRNRYVGRQVFHAKDVRMLLLSATPYKMYSTPEEIDETRLDEHYTEFLSVMNFLNEDPDAENHF